MGSMPIDNCSLRLGSRPLCEMLSFHLEIGSEETIRTPAARAAKMRTALRLSKPQGRLEPQAHTYERCAASNSTQARKGRLSM